MGETEEGPRLEDWAIFCSDNHSVRGMQNVHLEGIVFDLDGYRDGEYIHTSHLLIIDPIRRLAKTWSGNIFKLGRERIPGSFMFGDIATDKEVECGGIQ